LLRVVADFFTLKERSFCSLEEAENERMHLMTALEMKQPGVVFRGTILLAQGKMMSFSCIRYLLLSGFI